MLVLALLSGCETLSPIRTASAADPAAECPAYKRVMRITHQTIGGSDGLDGAEPCVTDDPYTPGRYLYDSDCCPDGWTPAGLDDEAVVCVEQ